MQVIRNEKQMKEVEVTIENYNLCDKCNEKIETEDSYDAFECEFIHKTGSSYPEGGSGENKKWNCVKNVQLNLSHCFVKMVIGLLIRSGIGSLAHNA